MPSTATYLAVDMVAAAVALVLAHLLRFGLSSEVLPGPDIPYTIIAALMLPVWLAVLTVAGCYDRRILGTGSEEYRRILGGGIHFLAVVALAHLLLGLVLARGFVGALIPVAVVLTLLGRLRLRAWLYARRRDGAYVHRTLLVGSPSTVVDVGEHLVRARWSGFQVVGACVDGDRGGDVRGGGGGGDGRAGVGGRGDGRGDSDGHGGGDRLVIAGQTVPVVGRVLDVDGAIEACGADSVAVTDESTPGGLRHLGEAVDRHGVDLLVAPAIADVAGPRTVVRSLAGVPLLQVKEPTFAGPQRLAKEAVDRWASAVGVVVLAPLFAVAALAIKLDDPGPVLFRQTRVGRDGRPFVMLKLRTMVVDAERMQPTLAHRNEADGALFKLRNDPRITRLGRFFRRFSLDELPQLWNVVRGEMSLVGPRPPLPGEVDRYDGRVSRRLLVKPGITGLWQVSGRSDLSWDDAVRLDLHYVDHWSPTMDLTIILKTFSAVIRGAGAY